MNRTNGVILDDDIQTATGAYTNVSEYVDYRLPILKRSANDLQRQIDQILLGRPRPFSVESATIAELDRERLQYAHRIGELELLQSNLILHF